MYVLRKLPSRRRRISTCNFQFRILSTRTNMNNISSARSASAFFSHSYCNIVVVVKTVLRVSFFCSCSFENSLAGTAKAATAADFYEGKFIFFLNGGKSNKPVNSPPRRTSTVSFIFPFIFFPPLFIILPSYFLYTRTLSNTNASYHLPSFSHFLIFF